MSADQTDIPVLDDQDTLDRIRAELAERALSVLDDAIREAAAELSASHDVDPWTARVIVSTLAHDGVHAMQTIAAAGMSVHSSTSRNAVGQAMGTENGTPLVGDGREIHAVVDARARAQHFGEPETVNLYGWDHLITPTTI